MKITLVIDYDFYSHSEAWDCLKSIIRHFNLKEAENDEMEKY